MGCVYNISLKNKLVGFLINNHEQKLSLEKTFNQSLDVCELLIKLRTCSQNVCGYQHEWYEPLIFGNVSQANSLHLPADSARASVELPHLCDHSLSRALFPHTQSLLRIIAFWYLCSAWNLSGCCYRDKIYTSNPAACLQKHMEEWCGRWS